MATGFWRFTGLMDQFVGAPAKGDLAGTYPAPRVAALTTTDGPTKLTIGDIAHGQFLVRDGTTVVGSAGGGGGSPTGVAGGDLSGNYPDPGVALSGGNAIVTAATSAGGDLSGTYPNPTVATAGGNAIVTAATAGAGDLGGTYPAPTVLKLTESAGPTSLTLGAVPATGWLRRDGAANVVGSVQLFTPMVTITGVAGPPTTFATNCDLGNVFYAELTTGVANTISNPTNGEDGATYMWFIDQSTAALHDGTITFGGNFAWAGGTAPTMTTGSGKNLVVSAVYWGTVFWATFSQDFA